MKKQHQHQHEQQIRRTISKKKLIFISQLRGLIFKQFTLLSRQKKTIFCQICFPFFLVSFLALFSFIISILLHRIGGFEKYQEFFNYNIREYIDLYHIQKKSKFIPYNVTNRTVPYKLMMVGEDNVGELVFEKGESYGMMGQIPQMKQMYKGKEYNVPITERLKNDEEVQSVLWERVKKNYEKVYTRHKVKWNTSDIIGIVNFLEFNNDSLKYIIQTDKKCDPIRYMFFSVPEVIKFVIGYDSDFCKRGLRSAVMNYVNDAYAKWSNVGVQIITNLQKMPEKFQIIDATELLTSATAGIALALLFPIPFFIYPLILEKSNKIRSIMKINGLKMKWYWIVNLGIFYLIYMIQCLFIYLLSLLYNFYWVRATNFFIFVLFGLICGFSILSMSVFISSLINKPMLGVVLAYIFVMIEPQFGPLVQSQVINKSVKMIWLMLFPPFAIHQFLESVAMPCRNFLCATSFLDIFKYQGIWTSLLFLMFDSILLFLLGFYLDEVMVTKWGIKRHPLFCFEPLYRFVKKKIKKKMAINESERVSLLINGDGDKDVSNEWRKVEEMSVHDLEYEYEIVIKNIHKKYGSLKAVNGVSFAVPRGILFGLLGPNGAGKTTLCHVLCGLISPDLGNAYISGKSIRSEISKIRQSNLSFCPQHDIYWPELTVKEHILFFGRIKGVKYKHEKELISQVSKQVGLGSMINKRGKQLSGGMKKRLSIAIALSGSPDVLIFDEPTTGLDPLTRRHIWEILLKIKQTTAVILTTHSLEEADIICDRMAIMSYGHLEAIGSSYDLKAKYGTGYKLFCNFNQGAESKVRKFICTFFPKFNEISIYSGTLVYQLELDDDTGSNVKISQVFTIIEDNKDNSGITEYSISQTTLEDVFLNILLKQDESKK